MMATYTLGCTECSREFDVEASSLKEAKEVASESFCEDDDCDGKIVVRQ